MVAIHCRSLRWTERKKTYQSSGLVHSSQDPKKENSFNGRNRCVSLPSSDPFFEKKKKNYDQGINSIYYAMWGRLFSSRSRASMYKVRIQKPLSQKREMGIYPMNISRRWYVYLLRTFCTRVDASNWSEKPYISIDSSIVHYIAVIFCGIMFELYHDTFTSAPKPVLISMFSEKKNGRPRWNVKEEEEGVFGYLAQW